MGRSTVIKSLLMDQKRIAGIGNIYADDILFRSGVHPQTPAKKLGAESIGADSRFDSCDTHPCN